MELPRLKYLIVYNKRNLKTLCFSHEIVSSMENFIKGVFHSEILFMNTNLGLEVFYISSTNLNKLIVSTLELVTGNQSKKLSLYEMSHYLTPIEIKNRITNNFMLLNAMPFSYKCYIQSWFRQLECTKTRNDKIIFELIAIWNEIITSDTVSENNRTLFIQYLNIFLNKNKDAEGQTDLVHYLAKLAIQLSKRN